MAQTLNAKVAEQLSVKDFGAIGDGVADDTAAVQAAIDSCRSIRFPAGRYRVGEITIPVLAAGASYCGDGPFTSTVPGSARTIVRAIADEQRSVFRLGTSSVSHITFKDMLVTGAVNDGATEKAKCGIDANGAPFLALENVIVTYTREFGVKTGHEARINRVYMERNDGVGLFLEADSSVSNTNLTQGTIPLWIVNGGGLISNIWANSGTECCILISALDPENETCGNVEICNAYVGEVQSETCKPIIKIQGSSGTGVGHNFPVRWVHLTNIFCEDSALPVSGKKISGGVLIDHAEDVLISNSTFYGIPHTGSTATLYSDYFVKATLTEGLKIEGCDVKGIAKNPVVIGADCTDVAILGNRFRDWAAQASLPTPPGDAACILQTATSCLLRVVGNLFKITGTNNSQYPAHVPQGKWLTMGPNQSSCHSNLAVATDGNRTGIWDASYGLQGEFYSVNLLGGGLILAAGSNIQAARETGTKIGTASTELLGFYGATPVGRPATVSDAATQDINGSGTVDVTKLTADLTSCKNAINALIDRLQDLGLIA